MSSISNEYKSHNSSILLGTKSSHQNIFPEIQSPKNENKRFAKKIYDNKKIQLKVFLDQQNFPRHIPKLQSPTSTPHTQSVEQKLNSFRFENKYSTPSSPKMKSLCSLDISEFPMFSDQKQKSTKPQQQVNKLKPKSQTQKFENFLTFMKTKHIYDQKCNNVWNETFECHKIQKPASQKYHLKYQKVVNKAFLKQIKSHRGALDDDDSLVQNKNKVKQKSQENLEKDRKATIYSEKQMAVHIEDNLQYIKYLFSKDGVNHIRFILQENQEYYKKSIKESGIDNIIVKQFLIPDLQIFLEIINDLIFQYHKNDIDNIGQIFTNFSQEREMLNFKKDNLYSLSKSNFQNRVSKEFYNFENKLGKINVIQARERSLEKVIEQTYKNIKDQFVQHTQH